MPKLILQTPEVRLWAAVRLELDLEVVQKEKAPVDSADAEGMG